MPRNSSLLVASVLALSLAPLGQAQAFTTPFQFHCRGNACRAVAFADEGSGCTVATNHSPYVVAVTQGLDQAYALGPGETRALLNGVRCYGYYDGGETANFAAPLR